MQGSIKKLLVLLFISVSFPLFAAEHKIMMLDEGAEGIMVFDPPYLKAEVGDTITFVAKDPGHNIISRLVPERASDWKGVVSNDVTVTLDKEGVYLYECDLHKVFGMVGVIQVGKPVNLDKAKSVAAELSKKMAMSPERLDEYLSRIK